MISRLPFFYILIRSWKAFGNFDRCVDSVFAQRYGRYRILFVDDASGLTPDQRYYIRHRLKKHVTVFNRVRKYSVRNAYEMISRFATQSDAVVINLDGDDCFFGTDTLSTIGTLYTETGCYLTYGECLMRNKHGALEPSRQILSDCNVAYPSPIIERRTYRKEPFYPLHPRSWKVWLFKRIRKDDFLRPDGTWLSFCEDMAMFFPMLEMANGRIAVSEHPLYEYTTGSPMNDVNADPQGLLRDELIIRRKSSYAPLA